MTGGPMYKLRSTSFFKQSNTFCLLSSTIPPFSQQISVMRAVVTFVLSFVASTLGFMVTFPNGDDGTGWTTQGPQMVQWTSVATDPQHFNLNLTNQNIQNFKVITLASGVDGKAGSLQVSPPPGGFSSGSGFRLDFVTSVNDPNDSGGILAQSNQFNITSSSPPPSPSPPSVAGSPGSTDASGPTGTPGSDDSGSTGIPSSGSNAPPTGNAVSGSTSTVISTSTASNAIPSGTPSASGSSANEPSAAPDNNAASSRYPVQTSLLVLFSLVGFTLAW